MLPLHPPAPVLVPRECVPIDSGMPLVKCQCTMMSCTPIFCTAWTCALLVLWWYLYISWWAGPERSARQAVQCKLLSGAFTVQSRFRPQTVHSLVPQLDRPLWCQLPCQLQSPCTCSIRLQRPPSPVFKGTGFHFSKTAPASCPLHIGAPGPYVWR